MKLRRFGISQISHKHKRLFKATVFAYSTILLFIGAALGAAFSNSPFPGGWEFTGCIRSTTIAGQKFDRYGLHSFTMNVDGNFTAAPNVYPGPFNKPGITIEMSYPYYIQRTSSGLWVESDEPHCLDHYNVTLVNNASEKRIQTYYQWTIGLDVIIKTDAAKYYKTQWNPAYLDYGYWFENDIVDVTQLVSVAATPWTPAGTSGNWTIVGGWNGIMSASIVKVDYGLVETAATENYGHTIQNINSVGSALNMYTGPNSFTSVPFSSSAALQGIPTSMDIEVGARLGAGCQYQNDWLGHVFDLAVRNVFVEYHLRIDLLSTTIWFLNLGHQTGADNPDENNTSYNPHLTSWEAIFEGLRQFFYSAAFPLFILILSVGGIVIVILYVRGRGRGVRVEVNSSKQGRR